MSVTSNSLIVLNALDSVTQAINSNAEFIRSDEKKVKPFVGDIQQLTAHDQRYLAQKKQVIFYKKIHYFLSMTKNNRTDVDYADDKRLVFFKNIINELNDFYINDLETFNEIMQTSSGNNLFLYLYFLDLLHKSYVFHDETKEEMTHALLTNQSYELRELLIFLSPLYSKDNKIEVLMEDLLSVAKIKDEETRFTALTHKLTAINLTFASYPLYLSKFLQITLTSHILNVVENHFMDLLSIQLLSQKALMVLEGEQEKMTSEVCYLGLYGAFRVCIEQESAKHGFYQTQSTFYKALMHDVAERHLEQFYYLNSQSKLESTLDIQDVLLLIQSIQMLLTSKETGSILRLTHLEEKNFYCICALVIGTPRFHNETLNLEFSTLSKPVTKGLLKYGQYHFLLSLVGGLLELTEFFPAHKSFNLSDYQLLYRLLSSFKSANLLESFESKHLLNKKSTPGTGSFSTEFLHLATNALLELAERELASGNEVSLLALFKSFGVIFKDNTDIELNDLKDEVSELKKFLFVFSKLKKLHDEFFPAHSNSALTLNYALLVSLFCENNFSGMNTLRDTLSRMLLSSVKAYALNSKSLTPHERTKISRLLKYTMPALKAMHISPRDETILALYFTELSSKQEGRIIEKAAEASVPVLAPKVSLPLVDNVTLDEAIPLLNKKKKSKKGGKNKKTKPRTTVCQEEQSNGFMPLCSEATLTDTVSAPQKQAFIPAKVSQNKDRLIKNNRINLSPQEKSSELTPKEKQAIVSINHVEALQPLTNETKTQEDSQYLSKEDNEGFQEVISRRQFRKVKKHSLNAKVTQSSPQFFKQAKKPFIEESKPVQVLEVEEVNKAFTAFKTADFPSLDKSTQSIAMLSCNKEEPHLLLDNVDHKPSTNVSMGMSSQQFYQPAPAILKAKLPELLNQFSFKIQTHFGVPLILTGKSVSVLLSGQGIIHDYDCVIGNIDLPSLKKTLSDWGHEALLRSKTHPILMLSLGEGSNKIDIDISSLTYSMTTDFKRALYEDASKRDLLNTTLHLPLEKGESAYYYIYDTVGALRLFQTVGHVIEINPILELEARKTPDNDFFKTDPIRFLRVMKEYIEQEGCGYLIGPLLTQYQSFIHTYFYQHELWNDFFHNQEKSRLNRSQFQTKLSSLFTRYSLDNIFLVFSRYNIIEGLTGLDKTTINYCFDLSIRCVEGNSRNKLILFYLSVCAVLFKTHRAFSAEGVLNNNFFHSVYLNETNQCEFQAIKQYYLDGQPIEPKLAPFASTVLSHMNSLDMTYQNSMR